MRGANSLFCCPCYQRVWRGVEKLIGKIKKGISSILSGFRKLPADQTLKLVSPSEDIVQRHFPYGVDFGTTAIKLVQIGIIDGKPQIINLIIEQIPEDLLDSPKDRKRALPEIFKRIVQTHKIKGRVVAALPSSLVQMKMIQLPNMPADEIDKAVKWELSQTSSIALEDLSFDYYILDGTASSEQIKLMAISCSKKDVLERLALIRQANLFPVAVETDSLATVSVLIYNSQIKKEEVILFLEFSYSSCSLNIVVNNQIYLTRELSINGKSLTQAISEHCHIPYEEAERLKVSCGLIDTEHPAAEVKEETAVMVNEALWLHLENLIQEIDYTFKYFLHQAITTPRISKLDKIILSGGLANLNRFSTYLASYLNTPVEVINPFKEIPLSPKISSQFYSGDTADNLKHLAPRLSVAMGLALREV